MKESKYYKKKMKENRVLHPSYSKALSKFLLATILVLGTLVVTNLNSKIREFYVEHFLERNISFSSINKVYQKYIGNLHTDSPRNEEDEGTVNVSNNANDLGAFERREVNGSYEIEVGLDYPITFLASGIIVYIGDKGDLKNTIIVQGNDGVDIWYSNIISSDYSLYDYVSKGNILGTTNSDTVMISILKDGKKISYDEYF